MDFDASNRPARDMRATLPANNNFTIAEMGKFPVFFGWTGGCVEDSSFRMFLGGHDDAVALRFFWNGSYERTTLRAWAKLAKRGGVAIDVGAHTGVFTLAALAANPSIQVVAFEPYYMNYGRLNLNMRANARDTRHAFMCAVGARSETAQFGLQMPVDRLSTGGTLEPRKRLFQIPVSVVALDDFLPAKVKPAISLVKIDTEGYEGQCIDGMKDIIATSKPVIFCECTTADSGASVQGRLAPLGYRFFEVDDDAGTIAPVDTIRPHFDAAGEPVHSRANRIALPAGATIADILS